MRTRLAAFALVTIFLFLVQGVALAEPEEVLLRDGTGGMADVLGTTEDSVTIKFVKDGADVQLKLMAHRMDPYSFYSIRRRHMENTAENHLKLAEFLIQHRMYNRARQQVEDARELDPEKVKEVLSDPRIREGIADKLLENAKACLDRGEYAKAEEDISIILTTFSDTAAAKQAEPALKIIEERDRQATAKKRAAEAKKEQEAKDEAQKAKQHELNESLKPIYDDLENGRKRMSDALRLKEQSGRRRAIEEAAAHFERGLKRTQEEAKKHEGNPALLSRLSELEATFKGEAVDAYISAGGMELMVRSIPKASEYARKALLVDPESQKAKSFLNQVQLAGSMGGRWGRR